MIRGKYLPSTTSPRGLWEMWECGLIPYGVYLASQLHVSELHPVPKTPS